MIDIAIKNCKIVMPCGIVSAGIAIDNGKIVAVASDANIPTADKTIDARGKHVIPGVVDPHVHIGAAKLPDAPDVVENFEDDIRANSQAAAIGGVTTYGHHLHAGTKKLLKDVFDNFKQAVERGSMIDIFFHAQVVTDEHIQEIPDLAKLGVTSFKFFFNAYKGPDGVFATLAGMEDAQLFSGFEKIGETMDLGYKGTSLNIHAENQDMIYKARQKVMKEGRGDLVAWSDSIPPLCEAESMMRAINIAKAVRILRTPPQLYIAHMSIGSGVDIVARAKAEGVNIIAETCPHYLTLTKYDKLGSLGKVRCPLRDKEDNEKLWSGIRHGLIETVGSDNITSAKLSTKTLDIWKAFPGLPGDGYFLIMLSEGVSKGRISFEKLVEVCCQNPAKVFGIFPKKGTISVGSDADIAIIDMNKCAKATLERLHSSAEFSVYDGWEIKGWPILTMLRGNIIMEDGEITGKLVTGKYIPRTKN